MKSHLAEILKSSQMRLGILGFVRNHCFSFKHEFKCLMSVLKFILFHIP